MATIRLVPSTYYLSSSYLSVSSASNMYNNTDNTTYGTVTNSRTSTSSYYIYLRGFNFDDVPSNAVVSNFSIKIKCNYSGGYSQAMYLYDGTSTSMGSSDSISSTVTTHTFSTTYSWEQIVAVGSDFGIRINCRRSSRNTKSYVYIYGAEIEVTYTIPNPRTITTTLSGSGTIDPSGAQTYYDGDEYTLIVTPTNSSDSVSATNNGSSITLTHHASGTESKTATAESFTTGFSGGSNMQFYTSSSSTGTNFDYAVGHTAESPGSTSSGNGSWTYVKENGSSTSNTGYADFVFDFSEIPASATINSVQVKCYGAIEDSSQSNGHADITLYSGSTQKGTTQKFTSSSNSTITLSNVGTWTATELHSAKLRFVVGYYGGHIFGITWTVNYTAPEYYSYTYTVSGDATIAVTIGGSVETPKLYVKLNGSWVEVLEAYKKISGSWVKQSDLTTVFSSGINYKREEG